MAFASVGSLGTAQEKVADASITLASLARAPVAGNVIGVWVAMDNVGANDLDNSTELAVTDSAGNIYLKLRERRDATASPGTGVVAALFVAQVDAVPTSITATNVSGNATAKAISAWEFSVAAGNGVALQSATSAGADSADPAAVTLSSLPSREYLLLWGFGCEATVNISTHDADYTAVDDIATSGGVADTNIGVDGAFRIATLTTDTVDATASAVTQHVQVYAAIYEVAIRDRLTQVVAEAVVRPTSGKARTTQTVAEAIVAPLPPAARLTQAVAEVIVAPLPPMARETQAVVEAVQTPDDTERQRFWDAVRSDGPQAIWRLDDPSGNFLDTSGPMVQGAHPFTPSGTVAYGQPGPVSGWPAISVAGGGGSQSSFSTQMDDITFEAWFMPTSIDADHQVIFSNVNGSQGWALLINQNGKLQVVVNGSTYLAESRTALDLGTWYHVVVMRRAGTWRYYVNGAVDTPNAGTATPGSSVTTMHLLGSPDLQASMATASYYHRALTGKEVRDHYSAVFEFPEPDPLAAHWKAGSFDASGTQTVALGKRPAMVMFFGANWTTEDAVVTTPGRTLFRGMVAPNYDDPSTLVQNAAAFSPGGDQHRNDNYAILNLTDAGSATVLYRATVDITDTGFTATFDTSSSGHKVVWVALMNVRNCLGIVDVFNKTAEFGFVPKASLLHGGIHGPVGSSDVWSSGFFGGAGYPDENDLSWQSHAAGGVAANYPNSVGHQYLNELWNAEGDSVVTTCNEFVGPFIQPLNVVAYPTNEGLLDFRIGGDSFSGGMAVAWDDEASDAGITATPDDVGDTVFQNTDGTRFNEELFDPALVISYSRSDEPDGYDTGGRGAFGFGVATKNFQWCAIVDGTDYGAYQSFENGFVDHVTGAGVHAGTIELVEDGFEATTQVASVGYGSWLWQAFGYPRPTAKWTPGIYRRPRSI